MGFDLPQYVFKQGRIDPGIDTQHPLSRIGECRAFYRIFFRQEYRIALGKGKFVRTVRMMVGKSMRRE